MLISEKQHAANIQNAQHSTGPKTPEGKAIVRRNALRWGLRARVLLVEPENPAEYQQLWNELLEEWLPADRTELMQLEQMAVSHWQLVRIAVKEADVYTQGLGLKSELEMLELAARLRARLERSFSSALGNLQRLKKFKHSQPRLEDQPDQAPAEAASENQTDPPAPPLDPPLDSTMAAPPDYVMSESAEAPSAAGEPTATDRR